MGSNHRLDEEASSQELFDFPGNNGTDDHNENPQQSKPKSSKNLRVSFASSSEMQVCIPKWIPSSAFGAEPATPMAWSATSNESLFSI
ncbi:hypothetical protein V6N13_043779 [Hibiscus sabdariffa]